MLVNNSGIIEDEDKNAFNVPAAAVLKTFQTNSLGALLVWQASAALPAKSKSASIINVFSGAGQLSDMGTFAPAYAISKAALNAVTCQPAAAFRAKSTKTAWAAAL